MISETTEIKESTKTTTNIINKTKFKHKNVTKDCVCKEKLKLQLQKEQEDLVYLQTGYLKMRNKFDYYMGKFIEMKLKNQEKLDQIDVVILERAFSKIDLSKEDLSEESFTEDNNSAAKNILAIVRIIANRIKHVESELPSVIQSSRDKIHAITKEINKDCSDPDVLEEDEEEMEL